MALAMLVMLELWGSSMGDLMKNATSVELVEVGSQKLGQLGVVVTGKLVEAFRSTRPIGSTMTVALGALGTEFDKLGHPGDRMLVVCDSSECPRAIGIERDGWFQLHAQEPMDGAMVYPPVVAKTSIPTLMVGKPTPSICLRGTIELLDDTKRPVVTAQIPATSGGGAGVLDGAKVTARLASDWKLVLDGGQSVTLAGGAWKRAKDGCLESVFKSERPVVRTVKSLTKALTIEHGGATTFASGTLVVTDAKATKTVRAGSYPLTLSFDYYARITLASSIIGASPDYDSTTADGRHVLGFTIDVDPTTTRPYPKLILEFPVGTPVAILAAKKTLDVPVSLLVQANATPTPLGVVKLAYVPEK